MTKKIVALGCDHIVTDEKTYLHDRLEEAGYEVTCLMQGLGELEKIRRLFVDHARAAMDRL